MADLCTTADVKLALKIGVGDTADDAYIASKIVGVSEWIQEYSGRILTPLVAQTYVVDTAAGSEIEVPIGVRTVTSLSVASADQPDTAGAYTAIATADVLLRPSPMYRKPGWPATVILIRGTYARLVDALNGASIVGDFGFATTPTAIRDIAIEAVALAYQNRRPSASGSYAESGADSTPWAEFFKWGSPQRQTLLRYRAGLGIG